MTETPITRPPTASEAELLAKVAHLGAQLVEQITENGARRVVVKFARNAEGDASYFYVD